MSLSNGAKGFPVCTKKVTLNDGSQAPLVGLGTWQGHFGSSEAQKLKESILHAFNAGYRLVDTAQYYQVESIVGAAIRESNIPRSEITLVTKFWPSRNHEPAKALEESLESLGVDYIDILLMHWPTTMHPDESPMEYPGKPSFVDTWKAMEKLTGPRCRNIGVSNFTQKTLEELLQEATIKPVVNQVELHAMNPNLQLVPWCQERGIQVMSWSTLGSERKQGEANPIMTNPLFLDIAKHHQCSVAVVSLSWAVQRNIIVIPKSSSLSRIEENIKLVALSNEELDTINNAHKTIERFRLADTIPGLQKQVNGRATTLGWSEVDFGWEDEAGNWLC